MRIPKEILERAQMYGGGHQFRQFVAAQSNSVDRDRGPAYDEEEMLNDEPTAAKSKKKSKKRRHLEVRLPSKKSRVIVLYSTGDYLYIEPPRKMTKYSLYTRFVVTIRNQCIRIENKNLEICSL